MDRMHLKSFRYASHNLQFIKNDSRLLACNDLGASSLFLQGIAVALKCRATKAQLDSTVRALN